MMSYENIKMINDASPTEALAKVGFVRRSFSEGGLNNYE